MARKTRLRRLGAAALAVAALGFLLGAARLAPPAESKTIGVENIKHPDYRGRFASDSASGQGDLQIKITTRDKQGRPLKGLFQPKVIPVYCVLGNEAYEAQFEMPSFVVYFRTQGRIFEGTDVSGQLGHQTVLIFYGNLAKGETKASGYAVVVDNPSHGGNEPYCSTVGKLPWSATAVR